MNKSFLLGLLIILIFSQNSQSKNCVWNNPDLADNITNCNFCNKNNRLDSSYFQQFLELIAQRKELPIDLVDLFIPERWKNESDPYRSFYGGRYKYVYINNFYIVNLSVNTLGLCVYDVMVTYNSNGKIVDQLKVAEGCDYPEDVIDRSFQDYNIYADTLIETYIINERADFLTDNLMDSIESVEYNIEKDTLYSHFVINRSGFIRLTPFTKPIYNINDLERMEKSQLRILRNEFYARYGYIFKNEDLKEYFSRKIWYDPRFQDVSDKLTPFEFYNVNLILKVEKEK